MKKTPNFLIKIFVFIVLFEAVLIPMRYVIPIISHKDSSTQNKQPQNTISKNRIANQPLSHEDIMKSVEESSDREILDWIGTAADFVAVLALLVALPFLIPPVWKSRKLLKYTIYAGQNTFMDFVELKIFMDILRCFFKYIFRTNYNLVDATRIWIEYEILCERPVLKIAPGEKVTSEKKASYRKDLEEWRKRRSKQINKALTPPSEEADEDDVGFLTIANCFELQRRSEVIHIYFQAVQKFDPKFESGSNVYFYSSVKIEDGYVAPFFLLTGPLRDFDEDWPLLDSIYEEDVNNQKKSWTSTQFSLLYIWLAWGPSIPICSCKQWQGEIALQYGFGDENNSIPLLIPFNKQKKKNVNVKVINDSLRENFRIESNSGNNGYSYIPVIRASVIARPAILSQKYPISKAQQGLLTEKTEFILVLNSDKNGDFKNSINKIEEGKNRKYDAPYYTAYVWILFEIVEEQNESSQEKTFTDQQAWRRLLPLFEHVNLGSPETYKSQKKLLVRKALELMKMMYKMRKETENIQFRYLCAFDHPNCECSELLVPLPDNTSIQSLLLELTKEEKYKDLPLTILSEVEQKKLSACHLNELIENLNQHLAELKDLGLAEKLS